LNSQAQDNPRRVNLQLVYLIAAVSLCLSFKSLYSRFAGEGKERKGGRVQEKGRGRKGIFELESFKFYNKKG